MTPTVSTDAPAELVHVDPKTLIVGANARQTVVVDDEFRDSIRENGVLQAITAYRDDNGDLVVLMGQRRTLAAVDVELPTVPVMVVPKPGEPDRISRQVTENHHRDGMTTSDKAAAVEQLSLLKVPAGQIAKRLSIKPAQVKKALAVAGSEAAFAVADDLTLEQAAAVAEFDQDPDAVKALLDAAQRGQFAHAVQRLRDQRAEARAKAKAAEDLAAAGITVINRPAWDDKTVVPLSRLTHDGQRVTDETHADCPGHAAYIEERWVTPEGGGRAKYRWVPAFVCVDYRGNGHVNTYAQDAGRKKHADMTETERETARAERRDVIQSNKDWDSAEKVRQAWLREFLTRKTAPKGTATFIAGSLVDSSGYRHAIVDALQDGNRLAHDLFGMADKVPGYGQTSPLVDMIDNGGDGRAQVIVLGVVLAACEKATSRNSWRSLNKGTARYLRFLEANGYELSTVELRACGVKPDGTEQVDVDLDPDESDEFDLAEADDDPA